MAVGPYQTYQPPGVFGPAVPPMMITKDSCLGSELVTLPDGQSVRYYLFTAVYNTSDCYYFVNEDALSGLPTNRLGIQTIADLGVYSQDWSVAVKNRDDKAFLRAVVKAFRNLLTVEEVHAL